MESKKTETLYISYPFPDAGDSEAIPSIGADGYSETQNRMDDAGVTFLGTSISIYLSIYLSINQSTYLYVKSMAPW